MKAEAPVRQALLLSPAEAAFVMIGLGFVTHEVVGEVRWLDAYFHWVPRALHSLTPAAAFSWGA